MITSYFYCPDCGKPWSKHGTACGGPQEYLCGDGHLWIEVAREEDPPPWARPFITEKCTRCLTERTVEDPETPWIVYHDS